MSNLYLNYKNETTKELIILYTKSCILNEYIHLLPIISRIKFPSNLSDVLTNKYYNAVSEYIDKQQFTDLCIQSISQINALIEFDGLDYVNIVDDFPNTFEKYNSVESNNTTTTDEFISSGLSSRFLENKMYVERYLRLKNVDQQSIYFNREAFQGAVSIDLFKSHLLGNLSLGYTDQEFFSLVPEINIGVRLVSNPVINSIDKELLYNAIASQDISKKEKLNAIRLYSENEQFFYFPIKLADVEYNLFNFCDKTMQSIVDFIDSESFDAIISLITKTLWSNNNFKKLFEYHIPIQILQPVLLENMKDKYKLLKSVYDKNLQYSNLNTIIINLIDKIQNLEDPTRL
jgi:hypothetical protein